jgi:hypothetical protein
MKYKTVVSFWQALNGFFDCHIYLSSLFGGKPFTLYLCLKQSIGNLINISP